MTYVEVYMIERSDLLDIAKQFPPTLRIIRRSAFRLAFRREMIRRAQENLDRVKAQREKDNPGSQKGQSASERLLVAVSSKETSELPGDKPELEPGGNDRLPPIGGGGAPLTTLGASSSLVDGRALVALEAKMTAQMGAIQKQLESIAAQLAQQGAAAPSTA